MKKIMFNDKYGLTQAVLDGKKTQTRRLVGNRMTEDDIDAYMRGYHEVAFEHAPYQIGEVVAVAQSYYSIGVLPTICADGSWKLWSDEPGWNNKMFVKAEMMPSRIKFTDMCIERLQDISDEDCLKEGISKMYFSNGVFWGYTTKASGIIFHTPQEAFAVLIDKVSGKGTWESNPWVFAYDLEVTKGGRNERRY